MRLSTLALSSIAFALAACGQAEPAAPIEPAALGQPLSIGEASYTVTSVETTDNVSSNQFIPGRASEGGILVVVKWTLKNDGTQPMEFYEKATMHLVDPAGVEYSSDTELTTAYQMSAEESEKVFSDINPGITASGADIYEVSAAAFDAATWKLKLSGTEQLISLQ